MALKDNKCPTCQTDVAQPANAVVCNVIVQLVDKDEEQELVLFTPQVKVLLGNAIPNEQDDLDAMMLSKINTTIMFEKSCKKNTVTTISILDS